MLGCSLKCEYDKWFLPGKNFGTPTSCRMAVALRGEKSKSGLSSEKPKLETLSKGEKTHKNHDKFRCTSPSIWEDGKYFTTTYKSIEDCKKNQILTKPIAEKQGETEYCKCIEINKTH